MNAITWLRDRCLGAAISMGLYAGLAFILALTASAQAVRPNIWQQHGLEAFASGEAMGISISQDGLLRLAPGLKSFATLDAERIWSLVEGPDGTIYAGTGDAGKVFKVDAAGQSELLFDSPEIAIHALAMGSDGHLYAGTASDGLIYKIDLEGRATTLAHTGEHYVWDLAFGAEGQLFAATGEGGKVLSIPASGEAEVLYDPPDRHVMTLQAGPGRLYAGTSGAGRIYAIDLDGEARLLGEVEQKEVTDLVAASDGHLYASALAPVREDVGPTITSVLYRIDRRGAVHSVWEDEETTIFDLIVDRRGSLMAAASKPAQLLRFDRSGDPTSLVQFEEHNPSRLLQSSNGIIYAGMAQAGQLWRLELGHRSEGHFDSSVEDFLLHSRWGHLSWRAEIPGGTEIAFQTRSGNSAEPDETWSQWSPQLARSGMPIDSPAARFLQYRALLKSSDENLTPVLKEVTISGQQTNIRPEILKLETYPYRHSPSGANNSNHPAAGANPGQAQPPRRAPPQPKSLRLVRWQAQDPNGDELTYSLYLRSVGQKQWKLAKEGLTQTSVIWDTETMPEGPTLIKLVASDRPDNPDRDALESERINQPFPIDNSPPIIVLRSGGEGGTIIEVDIEDSITPVRKAQYTIDYGERVHQIAPADGVFDSRVETAHFTLTDLPPGEHVIAVQAWDQLDNIGAQQLILHAK